MFIPRRFEIVLPGIASSHTTLLLSAKQKGADLRRLLRLLLRLLGRFLVARGWLWWRWRLFGHSLTDGTHGARESFARAFDGACVGALACGFESVYLFLHVLPDILAHLLSMLFERFFGLIRHLVRDVLRFDEFLFLLIRFSVDFRVFFHLLHFGLRKSRAGFDTNRLFLAARFVFCFHAQDAVGINVERDFDLRHAARRRWNTVEIEAAERFVIRRHRALALHHGYLYRRLIV